MTRPNLAGTDSRYYGEHFYTSQMGGSYRSALAFAKLYCGINVPRAVVDVGCGRGTWLRAFKDHGSTQLLGVDGAWNSQEQMIDQDIQFIPANLGEPSKIQIEGVFDLAMSLEVAEHVPANAAEGFVDLLTRLSDSVIFGAAYPSQGGANHVNEQRQTYWAEKFVARGYRPFDLFRPVIWGCPDVEYWYQQNTFLYVKEGSTSFDQVRRAGHTPITNLAFMECVHPVLYRQKVTKLSLASSRTLRARMKLLVPARWIEIVRNFTEKR